MQTDIDIRVEFHGKERLLRLGGAEEGWPALLEECGKPSPLGTKLPLLEWHQFNLRIEEPKGNVVSMEMGKLLASGVSIEDGWIGLRLASVMSDRHDDIGLGHDRSSRGDWGQILD